MVTATVVVLAGVLGALVGSFANVVIHRLPEGASIVHPGSACPACGRRLGPLELVPVLSWLAQRGRCRGCATAISARYPIVELLVAAGFALLAFRWSPLDHGAAYASLAAWWTILAIAALIDLDTYEIPDVLTLPGTAVLLLASFAWNGAPGLPTPLEAAIGAGIGAGVLTVVNRVGSLVLRRFRDTKERLWPIGFDQANLAAVAGTLGGAWIGLIVAGASLVANLLKRRVVRVPEPILWGAWFLALLAMPLTVGPLRGLAGGLVACGSVALLGAVTWWIHDSVRTGRAGPTDDDVGPASDRDVPVTGAPATALPTTPADPEARDETAAEEPVAMGFGDVKLAALLGVVLGWERLLVALFAAVLIGAVIGVVGRALGGTRMIPFGPFLALGGVLALFYGATWIDLYLGLLGVG